MACGESFDVVPTFRTANLPGERIGRRRLGVMVGLEHVQEGDAGANAAGKRQGVRKDALTERRTIQADEHVRIGWAGRAHSRIVLRHGGLSSLAGR